VAAVGAFPRVPSSAAEWPAIAQQPITAPVTNLAPQHPAYVIYPWWRCRRRFSNRLPRRRKVRHQRHDTPSTAR
jgi:hypothetical protein